MKYRRNDSGGSTAGSIATVGIIIVLIGLIFGFLKVTGISSVSELLTYLRGTSQEVTNKYSDCVHGTDSQIGVEVKCSDTDADMTNNSPPNDGEIVEPSEGVAPEDDKNYQISKLNSSLKTLESIPILDEVSDLPEISMEEWQHWNFDSDGCSTRDKILIDRGSDPIVDEPCKIISGSWISVYDDTVIDESQNVYLSYIVPLNYISYYSHRELTPEEKIKIANDPENIAITSSKIYTEKGSQPISTWKPENGVCQYAEDWVHILDKYGVMTTKNDSDIIKATIKQCIGAL